MPDRKYHIKVLPSGRWIKAAAGTRLMEALMDQGLFLRSDCGGKGICKKCRVKKILNNGGHEIITSCNHEVSEDITIEIPESAMMPLHIISKPPVFFPEAFKNKFINAGGKEHYGIATDLGTTTIAMYLCNVTKGEILSSVAVRNPQALYGDDVMSRIGAIFQKNKNLGHLQNLVIRAIEWGLKKLLASFDFEETEISQMVTVGNPTMIHILAGVDPKPIGISPYQPAFYDAKHIRAGDLGFEIKDFSIQTLPQVSGFIGGDILGAALAVDIESQPEGTLLVDLGTNGELLLKGKDGLFATSCATGPAFEGASLSCGMQAIPGAINKVEIRNDNNLPDCAFINPLNSSGLKPAGICGTGVISAVAQFCDKHIIEPGGAFKHDIKQYVLVPENAAANGSAVFISQKDIRSVQLGKAALITGIELLLERAGIDRPEKIIIAGAFGSFIDKKDMMTLGMIPRMAPDKVEVAGNSAGAGAIMVLCDDTCLEKSIQMASRITTVDLACNQNFQEIFIKKLSFPISKNLV